MPRNIKMEMNYHECFPETTRALYRSLWEQLFKSEAQVELQRQNLLKNPTFDIQRAYKAFDPAAKEVNGEFVGSIKRDALGRVLDLEGPYRDILFARFNKRMQVDAISYSEFIEEVTPHGPLF